MNAACFENKFTLNLKPHNHTFFEMHIVTSGSIVYRFSDGDVRASANSILLITPHTIHCIPEESENFQKITVAFEIEAGSELNGILLSKNKCVIPMDEELSENVDFIIRKAHNRSACSETMIKNRLSEIVYAIAESTGARPNAVESYDMRLLKAKKFIEDNQHIFLTCDEVASYCNLSSKQLGRLFLQYENTSLLAFIHGQKIETAKQMIVDTDELFDTISQKLGFSSVNYFGKFFMKHTGITPGDFRKKFDNSETFEESL
jgi:AraC-like DNA-binding protein